MKIRVAYIEEPPFYWTDTAGKVQGSDIELADVVLRAMGVTAIEHCPTSFGELLSGVEERRWDMNVPIFATEERAQRVAFSRPVWSLGDGLLVMVGNAKGLTSYEAVAGRSDARLGIVDGTVQVKSAKAAGVGDGQIVLFRSQLEAIEALRAGDVDAYPGTALGNRAIARTHPEFDVMALKQVGGAAGAAGAVGAFSFSKANQELLRAVNEQLHRYLGSPDHRARMAPYGLTDAELDGVVTA